MSLSHSTNTSTFYLNANNTEDSFLSSSSSELMTPVFEQGKYQPLSKVSVAALADLGYKVNMNAADPWMYNGANDNDTATKNPVSTGLRSGGDDDNSKGLMTTPPKPPSTSFILDETNIIKPIMMNAAAIIQDHDEGAVIDHKEA